MTTLPSEEVTLEEAKEYQKKRQEAQKKQKEVTKALVIKALMDGETKEAVAEKYSMRWMDVNRLEAELIERQNKGVLIQSYLHERKKLLPEVLRCGLNLLANGLKHRLESGEPLDLREAKIVSEIISNVDHIARLDAGDPTSIVDVNKTVPATLKDMVAALKKDPFIDTQLLIKEITYDANKEELQGNDSGGEAAGNQSD